MKIVFGMSLSPEEEQAFREDAPGCRLEFVGAGRVTADNASDADAVFGNPPLSAIPAMKRLRLLQLNSAGNEGFDAAVRAIPGAVLCNASGAYGLALSEFMLAQLLMLMKNLYVYRDQQAAMQWRKVERARSVSGARIMALGLGDVGTQFALRVKALGAHVIGVKRTPGEKPDCVDELYTVDALDTVLPTVDAACLSLPNTADTRGLLNAARIASMKPGAYVLNVGRGSAIDQRALAEALNSGRLGGAALDVTVPEPLPADSPLWTAKNCVITPHAAGGWTLPQTRENVLAIMHHNLRAFVSGGALRSVVDLEHGY